jgi:carbamoyltransferase
MPQCAQVLYGGAVVGTVVGRQEVGPRALGHRSLLAYPGDATMRDRINRIKARQWYRPVAPIVCAEQVGSCATAKHPTVASATVLRQRYATTANATARCEAEV